MFISDAFAQAADAANAPAEWMSTIVQLGLIFVIFYILLIRPQQKKIKQHEALLTTIIVGDKIITGGGLLGTVKKVDNEQLEVTIAEGVNVIVYRSTVRDVIREAASAPQPKEAPKKKKK